MKRKYVTHYSEYLRRDMHMIVYGHTGVPMLAIPCQDGMCDNWESFQMPEELSDFLEAGQIQIFTVDTVDTESWSDKDGDKEHRAFIQEQYYRYLIEEARPLMLKMNGTGKLPIVTGFSMGGAHASIAFFRRPELFRGVLVCSGCYSAPYFWDGWCNSTLYDNSPLDFLRNMPKDHPYIELYNQKKIVLCVGQGQWEGICLETTKAIKPLLEEKGIGAWVDIWGYDVDHDWPWWKKQVRYHLPAFLE